MSVTAKAYASGDNAVSAAVKNSGRNDRLVRRCAWVAAGFIESLMESAILRSLVLRDPVLYAGPFGDYVDGFGFGFLMRLRVRADMGSSSFVILLSVMGVVLAEKFFTLGDGLIINGILRDEGMSDGVYGGGMGSGCGTLRDVCVFFSSYVCVRNCGCSVGVVVWETGAWRMIKLLAAVASCLRYLIDVFTFQFYMPLSDCLRFRMDLTTR